MHRDWTSGCRRTIDGYAHDEYQIHKINTAAIRELAFKAVQSSSKYLTTFPSNGICESVLGATMSLLISLPVSKNLSSFDVWRLSLRRYEGRPHSSVGRGTVYLMRRSWFRLQPSYKEFFFTSCGSLTPFTRANAQWVFHGFHIALKFTLQS